MFTLEDKFIHRGGDTQKGTPAPWAYVLAYDTHGLWVQLIPPGERTLAVDPPHRYVMLISWSDFAGQAWEVRDELPS